MPELAETCPISAKEAFEYYKKHHMLNTSHQHHQKKSSYPKDTSHFERKNAWA